jgi:hypothetical protein
VVNAVVVNIIRFYSVSKKKTTDLPSKKPKASAGAITKQFISYVHNITCGKVINIPVSEIKKTGLPTKKTRATIGLTKGQPKNDEEYNPTKKTRANIGKTKGQQKMMMITIHWRKYKSLFVAKLLTLFSQRTAGHWCW